MNINGFDIKDGVLLGYSGEERDIVLPKEVKEIGDQAFFKQIRIKSITAKYAIQRIGSQAFFDCVSLKEVSLRGGVKEIASDAFWGCTNLEEVTLPSDVAFIDSDAFGGCEKLKTIKYHGDEKEWNAIQRSDAWADGVENIAVLLLKEKRTIYPCGVPAGVTVELSAEEKKAKQEKEEAERAKEQAQIKKYKRNKILFLVLGILAFAGAIAVANLFSYRDEMSIYYMLSHMYLLILPLGAALFFVILSEVFSALKNTSEGFKWSYKAGFLHFCTVFLLLAVVGISIFSFVYTSSEKYQDGIFYSVNKEDGTAMVTGAYEKNLSENVVIPESIAGYKVTKVKYSAFGQVKNKSTLKSIEFPNTLKSIENSAFEGFENLASVNLPEGLETIGPNAFRSCGLTSVTLPESLKEVGYDAFDDCPIKELVLPVGLGSSSSMGIEYNLESLVIYGEGEIKSYSFDDYNLKSLTIQEGVTKIGKNAFERCYELTTLVLPKGLKEIDDEAFSQCKALTTVTLPEGLERIGKEAFTFCESLTTIVFGASDQLVIEEQAFSYEEDLSAVVLPEGLTKLGNYAFTDCSKLRSVTIPSTVQRIGYYPFKEASSRLKISYNGTVDQWSYVRLDSRDTAVVHCTDGDTVWWD